MKKKLLFMCINMNIGGTEKALLNMIAEIPKDKYEVTILMLEQYGGFLSEIPEWVKVKYLDNYSEIKPILNNPPQSTIKKFIRKGRIIKAVNIAWAYYTSKILRNKSIFFKYILSDYSILKGEYDLAVAYAGPMDFITYYVLNKIKANKKAQWIHFDIELIGFDKYFAGKHYSEFNKIFIVSEKGKEKLLNKLPNVKDKVEVFYNIVSEDLVREMSVKGNGFEDEFDGTRILTVGRLSKEKGQDLFISALAKLKSEGYKVRGYIIGDGPNKNKYQNLINNLGLKDNCILLGAKKNPYPYMKECDIYVQPSRHEGYCITLAEARCFNSPIITTEFTGASEQLINEERGVITKIDSEDIYLAMKKLLDNKRLIKNIKIKLEKEIVDSRTQITKLSEFISSI